MRSKLRTLVVWAALVAIFLAIYATLSAKDPLPSLGREELARDLSAGVVLEARLSRDGRTLVIVRTDGSEHQLDRAPDQSVYADLTAAGVALGYDAPPDLGWVPYALGLAIAVLVLLVFYRQRSGGNAIFSVGKSRARLIPDDRKATFADVGGLVEAKEQLADVVDYLKRSAAWKAVGVRPPRGILLEGPPGSGKTLLARALAGEAKVPFFVVSASEFVELFVGVGAARVRDMFEEAKKKAPCVLFIDELDAVGRRRGTGLSPAHDEREQTLNQLLVSLDGFDSAKEVIVVAATNRPDVLDAALLRPGRFDRRVRLGVPDQETRLKILEIHTRGRPLASEVSLPELAGRLAGATGATLESMVNEAAVAALRRTRRAGEAEVRITAADLEEGLKVVLPPAGIFTKLDVLLIESASQIAQPTGSAVVRVLLGSGESVEGELLWADGTFVKLKVGERELVLPKSGIRQIETLAGTELARAAELSPDPWAHRAADVG